MATKCDKCGHEFVNLMLCRECPRCRAPLTETRPSGSVTVSRPGPDPMTSGNRDPQSGGQTR